MAESLSALLRRLAVELWPAASVELEHVVRHGTAAAVGRTAQSQGVRRLPGVLDLAAPARGAKQPGSGAHINCSHTLPQYWRSAGMPSGAGRLPACGINGSAGLHTSAAAQQAAKSGKAAGESLSKAPSKKPRKPAAEGRAKGRRAAPQAAAETEAAAAAEAAAPPSDGQRKAPSKKGRKPTVRSQAKGTQAVPQAAARKEAAAASEAVKPEAAAAPAKTPESPAPEVSLVRLTPVDRLLHA